MEDDDLFVIGAEPGVRRAPGSRRRDAYFEDDGVAAVGQDRPRPTKARARRPTGLWEYWLHVMEPALFHTSHSAYVARPIFNKHVREMRERWDDHDIMEGMRRFAAVVEAGALPLRGTPWFVFYGRREQFVAETLVIDRHDGHETQQSFYHGD